MDMRCSNDNGPRHGGTVSTTFYKPFSNMSEQYAKECEFFKLSKFIDSKNVYMRKFMKGNLRFRNSSYKEIKKYAKKLLETDETNLVTSGTKEDEKDKKNVVNIRKLIKSLTNEMTLNAWHTQHMAEPEYMIRFLTPLLDIVISPFKNLKFKPGEQKVALLKMYANHTRNDDEKRLLASNIDGIINLCTSNVTFSLLKLSGPRCSESYFN